jgi:hypothetical protein
VYSNFITPPDFVEDRFHTVTVVNATLEEVELLGRMCKGSDDQFNIYLYRSEMNDTAWLDRAVELSDAVIVNTSTRDSITDHLCTLDKTYYYGPHTLVTSSTKVDTVFQYFAVRYHQQNK